MSQIAPKSHDKAAQLSSIGSKSTPKNLTKFEIFELRGWPITVVYTVLGPMVRHYALGYGFHMFPNLLIKPLGEAHGFVLYTNA